MEPNSYTLLNKIPGHSKWFSILDLKDALSCITIDEQAQLLFAIEWQNPETKAMLQYLDCEFPIHIWENVSKRFMGYSTEIGNSFTVCRQLANS